MAKSAYFGSSSISRKVRSIYIGVGGVARKVKKGYIGVGSTARQFFSYGVSVSHFILDSLSGYTNTQLSATTLSSYAVFAGGPGTQLDVYNSSLVHSTPGNLSVRRYNVGAATVGSYAVIANGRRSNDGVSGTYSQIIEAFSTSFTRTTVAAEGGQGSGYSQPKGTTIGNYALFGGGLVWDGSPTWNCRAVSSSLVQTSVTQLSNARNYPGLTTVGNYAIFAGGRDNYDSILSSVEYFSTSLSKGTTSSLSSARYGVAATTVGNYALFLGGYDGSNYSTTVDAYNGSLVRTTAGACTLRNTSIAATSVSEYALFAGASSTAIDIYNANLTREVSDAQLSSSKYQMAAATAGLYAVFAGGYNSATADAYKLS